MPAAAAILAFSARTGPVTITSGSIDAQDTDSITLAQDTDGFVTLQDGSQFTFTDLERIEW